MATQFPWTNNNLACVNTWAFLRALKQYREVFKDAGTLKMADMDFWIKVASAPLRKDLAASLASQLDNMFVIGLRAKFESGFNRTKAVNAMTACMVKEDATLTHLAEIVDESYQFTGEKMS
jgi:hypothetical protein